MTSKIRKKSLGTILRITGVIWSLLLITFGASAELVKVDVNKRTVINAFDIELEVLEGTLHFAFDPEHPQNKHIVDIKLAPLQNDKVHATSTFFVIQPTDPSLRTATLLEISNRGSKAALRYFNKAQSNARPLSANDLGDGLIQRLGLSVMWVGWQADVFSKEGNMSVNLPRASGTKGDVRSDWTLETHASKLSLAHRDSIDVLYTVDASKKAHAYLTWRNSPNGVKRIVSPTAWRFSENGDAINGNFKAGIYELVYPSQESVIGGLGLALIRDTAAYIKTKNSTFESPKTIAFGVSQTGRWLRHFLYQGFNQTQDDNIAFDGMLIHTAGAGRGSFNHRFAQPSRDAHRMSAFFYPTDVFPFTSKAVPHPLTRKAEGLLSTLPNAFQPKIFYTNTGYEYWGRAAALIHTHEGKDIEPLDNERIYHLASAQHFVERRNNLKPVDGIGGYFQGNSLNLLLPLRALLVELSKWVIDDETPPESKFPRYKDNTLVTFNNYALPNVLSALTKPLSPHTAYLYDYGERWEEGVITLDPPRLLATIVPGVPKVDKYGNELGGIRHPLLNAPIASYLPWVLRHNTEFAKAEMMDFRGSIKLMSKASVLRRFKDWEAYKTAVSQEFDKGLEAKILLSEDRDAVLDEARWLWKLVIKQ